MSYCKQLTTAEILLCFLERMCPRLVCDLLAVERIRLRIALGRTHTTENRSGLSAPVCKGCIKRDLSAYCRVSCHACRLGLVSKDDVVFASFHSRLQGREDTHPCLEPVGSRKYRSRRVRRNGARGYVFSRGGGSVMMAFCSSSCSGARPTAIVQSVPVCSPLWRRGLKSTLVSFLEQGLSFPCAPCSAGSGGVSRATLQAQAILAATGLARAY